MDELFEDLILKARELYVSSLALYHREEKMDTAKAEVKIALDAYIDERIKEYFKDDGK